MSIPLRALAFGRKTDPGQPYRSAHTAPAMIRRPKPTRYIRRRAASLRRCSREKEVPSVKFRARVRVEAKTRRLRRQARQLQTNPTADRTVFQPARDARFVAPASGTG